MKITFEQKQKVYDLASYLAYSVIPDSPEGLLINPNTLSVFDVSLFSIAVDNIAGCFHLPVDPIDIFAWIIKNSEIILAGKYLLKGWKENEYYFLVPVLIKHSCEMRSFSILSNSFQEAA